MLAVVISVSAVGVERRVWVGCWVANLGLWALGFIRKFQFGGPLNLQSADDRPGVPGESPKTKKQKKTDQPSPTMTLAALRLSEDRTAGTASTSNSQNVPCRSSCL